MSQNDPNEPVKPPTQTSAAPPPLVRMEAPLDEATGKQDAEDQREWELYEIREKKQLKALFANRAYVDPDGKHLRISFGERVGDEDAFHTTVVMPLEEAYELGDLLTRMSAAWLRVMWQQQRKFLDENPSLLDEPDSPNG